MLKTKIEAPVVFVVEQGDGTSELAAGGYSPFTIVLSALGIEPATLAAESKADPIGSRRPFYSITDTISSTAKVEVVQ
ncbi:MAG: hypothetical protein AUG51_22095 [Acidobacteria bacterium 13_1_20CM_3_53_8]|nr:MAG: hypothetical protein AUG51_22095 [Acidobacteria bacterium 13_1_20CM_3_53_8]